MIVHPKISICIPAYNRSDVLPPLLESILTQDYYDYDILICEDKSPQRDAIREVVMKFKGLYPCVINYFENDENLGYDANVRNLVEKATGEYCFFMGNDDLMCPGALATVASALDRHANVGVVLRSYAAFDGSPDNISQTFRYFENETFFPAGPSTIATFYRRSVVIPGMVIHRREALKYGTEQFDGILLYQLYLVANVLVSMNGVFLPDIVVLYRNGGIPEFGNSEKERGKFVPEVRTPESSLHFMRGMFEIASHVEKTRDVPIYKSIVRDIGNYSYPILALQSKQPLRVYCNYVYHLARMGLWKNGLFYLYSLLLLVLGSERVDRVIRHVKSRLGYTPTIGRVYRGDSV